MAKTVRKFQYQQRDASSVKARATQRSGDFDSIYKEGVKIYKPREGKNKIRILPPTWTDADHYGYDLFINYGIGVDEQAYLSLSAMKKEPDPLAEARKQAEKQGNKTLSDSLKPTKRVGFYLIDRMAEDEGPQFWPSPWTVDKSFANLAIDEESGKILMLDHPDEGYDITFYKEGTGMTTKYPADRMRISRDPSPLSEDQELADEWLAQIAEAPIPSILNFYDYDHIAAAYEGHTAKGPAKDEDSTAKTKQKTSLARSSDVNDDEEMDEETGEVTKRNGKAAPKAASKPEPEATDEDDDGVTKASVSSIRSRLAGRRARPVQDDD